MGIFSLCSFCALINCLTDFIVVVVKDRLRSGLP